MNKKLLQMLEEVDVLANQLNNMNYSNKDDQAKIDSNLNKLDLIHDTLKGDALASFNLNKTTKEYFH